MPSASAPHQHSFATDYDRLNDAHVRPAAPARSLDSAVRVPGTSAHVGADAVLNLIPAVGTLTSKGMSGLPDLGSATPLRDGPAHGQHAGFDFVLSAIPLVGWSGDIFYRSNLRNMALLRDYLDRVEAQRRERRVEDVRNGPVIVGGER